MDSEGTQLPDIQQNSRQTSPSDLRREYFELLAPGPVHHPGSQVRNPILGTMATYSSYMPAPPGSSTSRQHRRKPSSHLHKTIHEGSIFDHTGCQESYFIIHPQWTSEAAGIRRMRTIERRHYNWNNRPAHTGPPAQPAPLIDYILPLMQKKREKDTLLRHTLQSAREAEAQQKEEPTDRERLARSMPMGSLQRTHTWGGYLPSLQNNSAQQQRSARGSSRGMMY